MMGSTLFLAFVGLTTATAPRQFSGQKAIQDNLLEQGIQNNLLKQGIQNNLLLPGPGSGILNVALAVTCSAGESPCDDRCMPSKGQCCKKGTGTYCEDGYYCVSNGCCPDGKVCSGTPSGCTGTKVLCGRYCIPAGAVCCSITGRYCNKGDTCTTDGKCRVDGSSGGSCYDFQERCGVGYCMPKGNVCCGNGRYCLAGQTCTSDGKCRIGGSGGSGGSSGGSCYDFQERCGVGYCMPKGNVCCGNGKYCLAGQTCTSDGKCRIGGSGGSGGSSGGSCYDFQERCGVGYCMPKGNVCCGNGRYCLSGQTCTSNNKCRIGGSGGGSSNDDDDEEKSVASYSAPSITRYSAATSSAPSSAPSFSAPSFTEPSFTEPSFTEPSFTEPSFTEPSFTEPSFTEPSFTEPSFTEPSFTEPSLSLELPTVSDRPLPTGARSGGDEDDSSSSSSSGDSGSGSNNDGSSGAGTLLVPTVIVGLFALIPFLL